MPFSQWSTPDNKIYFPAGEVVKKLPPGYYSINQGMNGYYLSRNDIKTEGLINFPDSDSDKVVEEINKFWLLEDKFKKSDVPFKRGMLLYGPPGSGKSCVLRQAVYSMIEDHQGIVADFENPYMVKAGYEMIRQIHPKMPIVFLMEDVDALLRRGNESEMLNLLDGMYNIDKVIFLATTNYPEQLGSRIMNRPSRFDKRYLIGMPTESARKAYLMSKQLTEDEAIRWAKDTEGFSIAHLKELFVANKIFGDLYEDALKTLKVMSVGPNSQSFDKYRVIGEKQDDCAKQPSYAMESKKKISNMLSEDKYKLFGTGKPYKGMKKMIVENRGRRGVRKFSNISDIANVISEDINDSNGLIS